MAKTHRYALIPALAALTVASYLAAGKESAKTTVSDTAFLVGTACLVVGLAKMVKRTGFFYLPARGFKHFITIITNKRRPGSSVADGYEEYLRSARLDRTYKTPLLIGLASLAVSTAFALL